MGGSSSKSKNDQSPVNRKKERAFSSKSKDEQTPANRTKERSLSQGFETHEEVNISMFGSNVKPWKRSVRGAGSNIYQEMPSTPSNPSVTHMDTKHIDGQRANRHMIYPSGSDVNDWNTSSLEMYSSEQHNPSDRYLSEEKGRMGFLYRRPSGLGFRPERYVGYKLSMETHHEEQTSRYDPYCLYTHHEAKREAFPIHDHRYQGLFESSRCNSAKSSSEQHYAGPVDPVDSDSSGYLEESDIYVNCATTYKDLHKNEVSRSEFTSFETCRPIFGLRTSGIEGSAETPTENESLDNNMSSDTESVESLDESDPSHLDLPNLRKLYDNVVKQIDNGTGPSAEGIYGLQLVETRRKIIVYCRYEKEKEAVTFSKAMFGDDSNFVVHPSPPPKNLGKCSFCDLPSCPSVTGRLHDICVKEWIGCGSPILAIATRVWKAMHASSLTLNTLRNVRAEYRQFCASRNDRFLAEWTVGCPLICENKSAILTAAHPLEELECANSVTYLTQVRVGPMDKVVELGSSTWQVYNKRRALDVLIIQLHDNFDQRLLKKKIHSSCEKRYIDFEPTFDQDQHLKEEVTKRGASTGNTFGKIITRNRINMVMESDTHGNPTERKLVEAFGVSSIELNSQKVMKFAKGGDSGSVVFENGRNGNTRRAYGIIWRKQEIFSEIHNKFVKNATVCAKITNCLSHIEDSFNIDAFQRHTTYYHDCEAEYCTRL